MLRRSRQPQRSEASEPHEETVCIRPVLSNYVAWHNIAENMAKRNDEKEADLEDRGLCDVEDLALKYGQKFIRFRCHFKDQIFHNLRSMHKQKLWMQTILRQRLHSGA